MGQLSSPLPSPGVKGSMMLQELAPVDDPRTRKFESLAGAPAIVPQQYVKKIDVEKRLVQHLTGYLQAVFPSRALVNSETQPWLEVLPGFPKFDLKPDVFFCHPACYTAKDKPEWCEDEPDIHRIFGVLTSMQLVGDVFIGDCKCTINAVAFGECINHLHYIAGRLEGPVKGFLFDWESCWLLEVDPRGSVLQRVILQWAQVCMLLLVFSHCRAALTRTFFYAGSRALLMKCGVFSARSAISSYSFGLHALRGHWRRRLIHSWAKGLPAESFG